MIEVRAKHDRSACLKRRKQQRVGKTKEAARWLGEERRAEAGAADRSEVLLLRRFLLIAVSNYSCTDECEISLLFSSTSLSFSLAACSLESSSWHAPHPRQNSHSASDPFGACTAFVGHI